MSTFGGSGQAQRHTTNQPTGNIIVSTKSMRNSQSIGVGLSARNRVGVSGVRNIQAKTPVQMAPGITAMNARPTAALAYRVSARDANRMATTPLMTAADSSKTSRNLAPI